MLTFLRDTRNKKDTQFAANGHSHSTSLCDTRASSGLDQLESDVVDFWALVLDKLSDRYPRAGVTRELIDRYGDLRGDGKV